MNLKISNEIKKIFEDIASFLDVKEFILYGGTAVDLLNNKPVKDYDVAIKFKSDQEVITLRNRLRNKGFTIIEPWRDYIIHKNKKIILVYAKNKDYFLDIAFLEDFNWIGLYDVESIYISYPKMEIIDKYNGIKNLNRLKVNLVREVQAEDPYVLLGRFIYLCAKYNISLRYKKNKNLLRILKIECEKHELKNKYFNQQVIPSFYSHIFKAICRSARKLKFINVLIEMKIFLNIFPSLEKAFINVMQSKELINKLFEINDKRKLIHLLYSTLDGKDSKAFLREINKLKVRKWDVY